MSWVRIQRKPLVFLLNGGAPYKKEFAHCPSRTSLSNALYGNVNSVMMSSPSPTELMGPRTCMKTSYVLEMQHFLVYEIKMNCS